MHPDFLCGNLGHVHPVQLLFEIYEFMQQHYIKEEKRIKL